MGQKGELARSLFESGYNCCQAVAGAFFEEAGMEFDVLMQIAASFGGGVGGMREVCGAVSAMALIAGAVSGYILPKTVEEKQAHYALVQKLAEALRNKHGSIICRTLLGEKEGTPGRPPRERTPQYYKERPCPKIVMDAADILQDILFS